MSPAIMSPDPACDRRAAQAAQRALARLRDGLARDLERLLDDVGCPAGAEAEIRHWLSFVGADDPAPALTPDALETVLRSLSVAYADRFAYAGQRPRRWRPGEPVNLNMTDRGGALVIRAVRDAAAELARGIHGREGAALLRRVRSAEQEMFRSIAIEIGRAL